MDPMLLVISKAQRIARFLLTVWTMVRMNRGWRKRVFSLTKGEIERARGRGLESDQPTGQLRTGNAPSGLPMIQE